MLKKELLREIADLKKENLKLRDKYQAQQAAMFAATTAMQLMLGNQVGQVKPSGEEEAVAVCNFPSSKEFQDSLKKMDNALYVQPICKDEGIKKTKPKEA